MSKYSNELKLEVVKYCIDNNNSTCDESRHFGIPSHESIRRWCRKYEIYGPEGLCKNFKSSYSGEFKQSVVEYMREIRDGSIK